MVTSVYELKVVLREIKPPIWRRLQVSGDTSFRQLHSVLQAAFDWHDAHLHEFALGTARYGNVRQAEDSHGLLDESAVTVEQLLRAKVRFRYTYDFGDDWQHELIVERVLPADPDTPYPVCVAGARSGPPEDSGGPWGYQSVVDILADPQHEEFSDIRRWVGRKFDPDRFDLESVNKALGKLAPKRKAARHKNRGTSAGPTGLPQRMSGEVRMPQLLSGQPALGQASFGQPIAGELLAQAQASPRAQSGRGAHLRLVRTQETPSTPSAVPLPRLPTLPAPPAFPRDPRQASLELRSARIRPKAGALGSINITSGFPAGSLNLGALKDAIDGGIKDFTLTQLRTRWELDVCDWMHALIKHWVQRCKQCSIELRDDGAHIDLTTEDDRGYYQYGFDVFPGR